MAVKDAAAQIYERLLILRSQAGDEAALGELIARYSPGLRLFLRKMTRQAASVDDLLQDTWFDVYRKLNSLQQPEAFAAWLYRIARNKAYSALRRKSEISTPFDDGVAELIAVEEEEAFTPEDAEFVRSTLDELPNEQREVLLLRFIEDMSYEQISEVIEASLGTVRSRIFYAKQALRTKLQIKANRKGTSS